MELLSLNVLTDPAATGHPAPRRPTTGPLSLGRHGLEGEAPGGIPRALFAYPFEHYPIWQTLRAQARVAAWGEPLPFGALGEQLTLQGLTEAQAWVGDTLVFAGGCELAVSEPYFPGPDFDAVAGFPHASKMLLQSALCGFHLGVVVPGTLRSGERFSLRPGPREVGIGELFKARTGRL